ncbi:MAG: triose-phosphate isomerase [Gammaproteobacteria bacterium]|nr:MAG: triose-phosphate isomerase [Gammaproteobacteria bacterium]
MAEKLLIAGNWKMHKTPSQTEEFFKEFLPLVEGINNVEILICPPFISIPLAVEITKNSNVNIGAQNCYFEKEGAFTGEVSPVMLKEVGCKYVIIGHSERRHIFGESDELINKKVISALEEGLKVILCVGETLQERESGLTFTVVETQLKLALSGVEDKLDRIEIAYEPVWAIGTGVPAKPEDAEEVHRFIYQKLGELNPEKANQVRVLYGGSVKPSNAEAILNQPHIKGVLVGGASLKPDSFAQIVRIGSELSG